MSVQSDITALIEKMYNIKDNIEEVPQSPTIEISERSNRLISEGKEVYKLGLGQSPFPVPDFLQEELAKNTHQKDYLPTQGLLPLREAICSYYESQNIYYTPENIMVAPGTKELMFILQTVFSGTVLVPQGSWVSYEPQSIIASTPYVWIKTRKENNYKVSSCELQRACNSIAGPKILILNAPNNPTGEVYSEKEIEELAVVAKRNNLIVLSDDIYGRISHTVPSTSFAQYYPEGTIVSDGLSKWAGAGGWRIGHFCIPDRYNDIRKKMVSVASETYSSAPAPIQYATIAAYRNVSAMKEYVKDSNRVLKMLSQKVSDELAKSKLSFPTPKGGFYVLPDFSYYKDSLAAKGITNSVQLANRLLEDTGVAGLAGAHFGFSKDILNMRFSYVNFCGNKVMDSIYAGRSVTARFIDEHCPKTIAAFKKIVSWVSDL